MVEEFALRTLPFFQKFTPEEIKTFASYLDKREYKPNDEIIREGSYGDELYIINKGEAEVSLRRTQGKQVITILKRGDIIGERALVESAQRTATVRAIAPTEIFVLKRDKLKKLIDTSPKTAIKFYEALLRVLLRKLHLTNVKAYLSWMPAKEG